MKYRYAKIFKITSPNTQEIYVGATNKYHLRDVLNKFKWHFKRYRDGKSPYMSVFKILEKGVCAISQLEMVPCENRYDLLIRKRFYVETLENVVNSSVEVRNELSEAEFNIYTAKNRKIAHLRNQNKET